MCASSQKCCVCWSKGRTESMTFDECVFFFFLPFSPRKKTNKQTRKTTVENLCASRLAAVELVTATRFYPHSLTREREFRLGLWQTGQEGGVKRIGGGTQPPTRGRSTHTQKPASFSAIATRKKMCFVARIRAVCTCVFTN